MTCSKSRDPEFLRAAWMRAKNKLPCDCCFKVHQYHHATCWSENLCHDCYLEHNTPCTQEYPGDLGYPISTYPLSQLISDMKSNGVFIVSGIITSGCGSIIYPSSGILI